MFYKILLIPVSLLLIVFITFGALASEVTKLKASDQKTAEAPAEAKAVMTTGPASADSALAGRLKATPEAGEDINWWVISGGGLDAVGGGYVAAGTVGQPVISNAASATHTASHGYWQPFGGGCCVGIRGNANGDGAEDVNISDITFLVEYLFGITLGPAPPCLEEGNANGGEAGDINISDVTYLVDYLFGVPLGPAPAACP